MSGTRSWTMTMTKAVTQETTKTYIKARTAFHRSLGNSVCFLCTKKTDTSKEDHRSFKTRSDETIFKIGLILKEGLM